MAANRDGVVLVTGANGFLASYVVSQLLEGGHVVRGTVRPATLAKEERVAHLGRLAEACGAGERLELVGADILDEESMAQAMDGVTAVIHTASPYVMDVQDPVAELLTPAAKGTHVVLAAAAAAGSVTRVVLTSSMAAVTDSPDPAKVYTEADWNTESTTKRNPYYASKALAEKVAWGFVGVDVPELPTDGLVDIPPPPASVSFDLVVINPFIIIGPEFSPSVNTSNGMLRDIMDGKYPAVMDLNWSFVHVADVARAHVLALTTPDASGRYLIAHDAVSMKDTVDMLHAKYPDHALPTRNLSGKVGTFFVKLGSYFQSSGVGSFLRTNLSKAAHVDATKATSLGLVLTPVVDSVYAAVEDMRTTGKLAVDVTTVVDDVDVGADSDRET